MDENVTRIPLCRKDGSVRAYALIDAADAELVEATGPWRYSSRGYVARTKGKSVFYLARVLLGLAAGDRREVDHINLDPLDNRRSNLRVVSHQANMQNTRARTNSSSAHRGVYWDKATSKWRAMGHINGVGYHLGRFTDESAAADAARAWRLANMPGALD
jgi:hypothetical protein